MSWKDRAHEAISECYLEFADNCGLFPGPSMPEVEKRRLWRLIRKSYPFGERSMWPYKVWLAELRKVKAFLWPEDAPVNVGLFAD